VGAGPGLVGETTDWPGIEVTVAAGTVPVEFVVARSAEFIPLTFSLKVKAGLLTGIVALGLKFSTVKEPANLPLVKILTSVN